MHPNREPQQKVKENGYGSPAKNHPDDRNGVCDSKGIKLKMDDSIDSKYDEFDTNFEKY